MKSTSPVTDLDQTEPILNTSVEDVDEFKSLDDCLEHLGGAGRYQITVLFVMVLCKMFPGMVSLSAVFTNGPMSHKCSADWINSTFPNCSVKALSDQCTLMMNCSDFVTQTKKCQSFDYDKTVFTNTITSQFDLVCDRRYLSYISNMIFFFGFMAGSVFYGVFSDRLGRLKAVLASSINLAACTVITSKMPVYWCYLIGQFCIGLGNGGLISVLYTFALENTTTKYRNIWGFVVHNGWTVGMLLLSLIAYFIRDYQWLLFYVGLSIFIVVPLTLFLSESPRWLFSTHNFIRTDSVLRRIARINKRVLTHNFSSEVLHNITKSSTYEIIGNSGSKQYNLTHLLRTPGLCKVTLVTWFLFGTASMAYYGISLGLDDLGGDIYMNQVYSALVEPLSRAFGWVTSIYVGRKTALIGAFTCSGIGLLGTAALLQFPKLTLYRILVAMIGKFFVTLAFDLSWLYSAEVFPTVLRNIGIGMGSTMARVGAMGSQALKLLDTVWLPLPFICYAVGPILVSCVMICVPETKDKKLPESVEEAETFAAGGTLS